MFPLFLHSLVETRDQRAYLDLVALPQHAALHGAHDYRTSAEHTVIVISTAGAPRVHPPRRRFSNVALHSTPTESSAASSMQLMSLPS